ncbi:MAG: hypothetical protein BIFFINMI_03991 [Phycisphaerae bacterium]|nr:hypothetical protein [Phycisphaerae bacterium]
MRRGLSVLIVLGLAGTAAAATVSVDVIPTADTYVRQNASTSNYGTNGALSVAGADALNGSGSLTGLADTFIRFNVAAAVASLDAQFGAGAWTLTGATLKVCEFGEPSNNNFGRGAGTFEIRWLASDSWSETSLTWDTLGSYLSAVNDVSLGSAFANLGSGDQTIASQRVHSLPLAAALLADIRAGGDVSFLMAATSDSIGFTFNSRNITGATRPMPVLTLTAVPEPATAALLLVGAAMGVGRLRRR